MHRDFLGDSFDIVKRFWAERLTGIAPLLAHPRFIPSDVRRDFERLVCIPVLDEERTRDRAFGLFLDPDTGIPLPGSTTQKATRSYAPVSFVTTELLRLRPRYLICFDQSHDRMCGHPKLEQRRMKLAAFRSHQVACMYYVSHAPFLFAALEETDLDLVRRRLVESGIPEGRFERPV